MKPERWQQIDQLLEAALDQEESQRAAFLEEACAGDEALRTKVEALLEAHQRGDNFLEEPAFEMAAKGLARHQVSSLVGKQIGSYKMLSLLGAGGMGEVYLARDTTLDRQVALKFLPEELQQDTTARKRFLREAKSAAALDHPFICHIHEVGETEGQFFIAMEYVQGMMLQDQLAKGPLPVREAVETAAEIAEALEAAHKQTIVHRDLKPANIMLTPEGHVKVMDFGLAKRLTAAEGREEEITTKLTQDDSILGTVPYMSPEQLRGQSVDARSDIFSFGVVLYEMLTGVHPFKRGGQMETANAIFSEPVPPLSRYKEGIPGLLQHTVKKMLAKDPDSRYQLIHEVRTDLRELMEESRDLIREAAIGPSEAPSAAAGWWGAIPWSIAVTAVVLALVIAFWSSPEPLSPPSTKFVITPSPAAPLASLANNDLAISADGRQIVYRATNERGMQLYLHSLNDLVDRPLPGTEGVPNEMFFSPDGESVAFFAGAELKKVSLMGGSAVTICRARAPWRTGSWGSEETIVFSASSESGVVQLYRVLASGGEPEIVATPDLDKGETGYVSPQILPGGKALLFTINHGDGGSHQIAALSLETREQRILIEDGRQPTYLDTGHLIYEQAATGNLMAVPFNLARLEITSSPVPVLQGVRQNALVDYALSEEGTLVYIPLETNMQRLVWVDRKGTESQIIQDEVSFNTPRISPNGEQVALSISKAGEVPNLWIYDSENESLRRLTFGEGSMEIWSADGQWIIFRGGDSAGQRAISRQLADGSGPIEHLTVPGVDGLPGSQTPDGSVLAFTRQGTGPTGYDIMMLPM